MNTTLATGPITLDTHVDVAGGSIPGDGQIETDAHLGCAVPAESSPAISQTSTKIDTPGIARGADCHSASGKETPPAPHAYEPYLFTPELCMLAQQLDDFEQLRKAEDNRYRALTDTTPGRDGITRGYMLDPEHPAAKACEAALDGIRQLEHATELALKREMRRNPLDAWRKTQRGVGEKTLARLLNCIGDPYVRLDDGQPRTVSQLWAYCGLHTLPSPAIGLATSGEETPEGEPSGGPSSSVTQSAGAPGHNNVAARRMRGQVANWSTKAKTRAYLIAESCVKAGVRKDADGNRLALSEYGRLYIDRREHTAVTHPEWTPMHSQNDALRIVGKRVLRNLWRAARDIHEDDKEDDQ